MPGLSRVEQTIVGGDNFIHTSVDQLQLIHIERSFRTDGQLHDGAQVVLDEAGVLWVFDEYTSAQELSGVDGHQTAIPFVPQLHCELKAVPLEGEPPRKTKHFPGFRPDHVRPDAWKL